MPTLFDNTFYSGGQHGYVDYPELEASQPAVAAGWCSEVEIGGSPPGML